MAYLLQRCQLLLDKTVAYYTFCLLLHAYIYFVTEPQLFVTVIKKYRVASFVRYDFLMYFNGLLICIFKYKPDFCRANTNFYIEPSLR